VTAEDLCVGLNKIGIRANLEEALTLTKASSGSERGLSIQDFSDLIFKPCNNLHIEKLDTKAIAAPSQDEKLSVLERIKRPRSKLDLSQLDN